MESAVIWEKVDAMKDGQTVEVHYRVRGKSRWSTVEGRVVRTTDPNSHTVTRYAELTLLSGPDKDRTILFPQDGEYGTLEVEYSAIEFDEVVHFPSSPNDRDLPRHLPNEPRGEVDARKNDQSSIIISLMQKNDRLTEMMMEFMMREKLSERKDPAENEPKAPRPTRANMAYSELPRPNDFLQPGTWGAVMAEQVDLTNAELFFDEHYRRLSEFAVENHTLAVMKDAVKEGARLAHHVPEVTRYPNFLNIMELLIHRLQYYRDIRDGLSKEHAAATQRVLRPQANPDWIREAHAEAASMVNARVSQKTQAKNH